VIKHLGVTLNNIKASKDFIRYVTLGIEGMYNDSDACLSSVVQTYKNFTAGWQWNGHKQINGRVTLSILNVSLWVAVTALFLYIKTIIVNDVQFIKGPLQEELKLARKKRQRRYSAMIHFFYLGRQLWQNVRLFQWDGRTRVSIESMGDGTL
jgi:hypothetical protein